MSSHINAKIQCSRLAMHNYDPVVARAALRSFRRAETYAGAAPPTFEILYHQIRTNTTPSILRLDLYFIIRKIIINVVKPNHQTQTNPTIKLMNYMM